MAGSNSISPVNQGDLDGLCGIYALINSVRTLYPKRLSDHRQAMFFEQLIDYAIKEQGNLGIVSNGMGLRDMQQLMAFAVDYLSIEFGFNIKVTRPWRKLSSELPTDLNIKQLLINPKTSILISLEQPCLHWSVIRDYKDGDFILFDSQEHEDIPADEVLFTRKQNSLYDEEYVIVCSSIFVLRRVTKPF